MNRPNLTHPAPRPSVAPAPAPALTPPRQLPRRPLDLRVRTRRIQIEELVVDDPGKVLDHAQEAALTAPDTAAALGLSPTTPLTLPAAAALLCALHEPGELAAMGLRLTRHTTHVTASDQQTEPVSLELSYATEYEE
ncbi:hypothetical protein PV390_20565 [Streptomyces sp. ME02-6991-2A]|uniref:hypothetical protein n=1 Tax=Streptomyces sp. ME02-6991-2A TaxID=3028677 RepID=UPI0029BD0F6A|nr:hypothetical protein [Streptomyces sp. ME02-6991-2A]MDX3376794.1 hypothetical protein [Streptomyces sp. ME02-6991-2A]